MQRIIDQASDEAKQWQVGLAISNSKRRRGASDGRSGKSRNCLSIASPTWMTDPMLQRKAEAYFEV